MPIQCCKRKSAEPAPDPGRQPHHDVRRRVKQFFFSVASIFEAWVSRRQSSHTQRAYLEDVMAFVGFQAIAWPDHATALAYSVGPRRGRLPRPVDRAGCRPQDAQSPHLLAVEFINTWPQLQPSSDCPLRFQIRRTQFISRESTDARDATRALSASRARQFKGLPSGDGLLDFRNLAILKFFLYSGARLSTACRLKVSDFHQDGDQATIRLYEKGDKRRTMGLHLQDAQAIAE